MPDAKTDVKPTPRVAIVGAGALGTALALRLVQRGYSVAAVISRTEASARRLADRVGASVAAATPDALPPDVHLTFCCVPDDRLSSVAERLAEARTDWSGCTVAHTSGALTTDVLAPLVARGALTIGFHPMQTFPPGTPPEAFADVYVGLEGDAEAVSEGARIAADLGARSVVIPSEKKALYHLAGVLASNALVTLLAMARDALVAADVRPEAGLDLVQPLVESTWRNAQRHGPEAALTGPVARGDEATIARHAEALTADLPHLLPAYAALTRETVRLALRAGKLDGEAAQRLLDVLERPGETKKTKHEDRSAKPL